MPTIYPFTVTKIDFAERLQKNFLKTTGKKVRIDSASKKTMSAWIKKMIDKGYSKGIQSKSSSARNNDDNESNRNDSDADESYSSENEFDEKKRPTKQPKR